MPWDTKDLPGNDREQKNVGIKGVGHKEAKPGAGGASKQTLSRLQGEASPRLLAIADLDRIDTLD